MPSTPFALSLALRLVLLAAVMPLAAVAQDTPPSSSPSNSSKVLELACDGKASTCTTLGRQYELGQGRPQDESQAEWFYSLACKEGDAPGCAALSALKERRGAPAPAEPATPEASKAVQLAQSLCDGGEPVGCGVLATLYAQGVGIAHDIPRAKALYKKACDGGEFTSCQSLDKLEGRPPRQPPAPKVASLAPAAPRSTSADCDGGNGADCLARGLRYRAGRGVARDFAQAALYFKRACDAGDFKGCAELGLAQMAGGGLPRDRSGALASFVKACNGGAMAGCGGLGAMLFEGMGVRRDVQEGLSLMERACTGRDARSCSALALIYRDGIQVGKDEARAAAMAHKACELGVKKNCAPGELPGLPDDF